LTSGRAVAKTGIDAVALKPAECDVADAHDLPFESIVVDFEGRDHLPDPDTLAALARDRTVRVTVPVRADGFDPLGDDTLATRLPDAVDRVYVAGHPAYLSERETARSIAPRLGAAVQGDADAWVGTEGVQRIALATGATQFELLSRHTERDVRAMRDAGFDGTVAVYAPTALASDESAILDAVGGYAARRQPVSRALDDATDDGCDAATDGTASGRTRDILSKAVRDYALVGTETAVRDRVSALREAGVDTVVGYPAQGLDAFRD
jgi:hypothetical protein